MRTSLEPGASRNYSRSVAEKREGSNPTAAKIVNRFADGARNQAKEDPSDIFLTHAWMRHTVSTEARLVSWRLPVFLAIVA
jgi:hypothetical protein